MNEAARTISLTKTTSADVQLGTLPDALPFLETQLFDLVCLFDVLEHVEDDIGALRAVRGLLAPGAAAIITVPAYKKLFGPHDVQLHHKRRYEREELRNLFDNAGLKVEKLSFMNTGLLPIAWLLRVWDKAKNKDRASGAALPPPFINIIFSWIFGAEAYLLPQISLPFGLSIIAIVRRTD
jgi:SAM-dependent methyltransferase